MTDISRKYEIRVLTVLFLTWGFIFMNRLSMGFIAPVILSELGMNNTQLGWVGFTTAFAFAISSLIFGFVSDKLGYRKKVLLPFIFGTFLFTAAGGLVHSFGGLLVVRALLGFSIGPIFPLLCAILFTLNKNSFGRNIGIITAAVGIIGTTMGPVLITQLAASYSFQMTFVFSSLPTLVIFFLVLFFVKEVHVEKEPVKAAGETEVNEKVRYTDVFKYRNVVICLIMCTLGLAGYWTMMLYSSVYLVEVAHFNLQSMGWATSGMGVLYLVYSVFVPKLTDNFGRKPVLFIGLVLSVIAPLFMFIFPGAILSVYTYILFFGFTAAVIPIFMTMIPIESVPLRLAASVGAMVQGVADILGGAIWPVIAGRIADSAGLPIMMLTASVLLAITAVLTLLLKETYPRVHKQKSPVTVSE